MNYSPDAEWLETAGDGAFATGSVSRVRTRRYHALLMRADSPSAGRRVLVPGFDAWLELGARQVPLTQQRYQGGTIDPAYWPSIEEFAYRPWPTWTFGTPAGPWHEELFISAATGETVLRWRGEGFPAGAHFCLRPFLACRDYHALQSRDDAFCMDAEMLGKAFVWRPYHGAPSIAVITNGAYRHEPYWYERFEYDEERARGFDHHEDLASPGVITWILGESAPRPVLILRSLAAGAPVPLETMDLNEYASGLERAERARRASMSPLEFSASQFIVRRGTGKTVIAGYPWFTDWGRDTFIAIRGLCLSPGRMDDARAIIETWADAAENGLLPNRFSDNASSPDYCAMDASLWFVIAAHELLRESHRAKRSDRAFTHRVRRMTDEILAQFARGTDFGICADHDGLLMAAGEAGRAVTWMDACVNGAPVTPRIGKPVEVQCLWVNALETARRRSPELNALLKAARRSFLERFWRSDRGYLADVVDVGQVQGAEDESLRPNQIFAVAGLPHALVPKHIGRKVVEVIERELFTPLGLRTLAPRDPAYRGRYAGGAAERDGAYHQGTVWPWLMGPFGEAVLRVHRNETEARDWIREKCLSPLRAHLESGGLGHLSEIADGDPPHTPNGCPFQAWSLGEFLRLESLCASGSPSRG